MSDTPRTDSVANAAYPSQYEYSRAMTRHARELERELLAALVAVGKVAVRHEIKRRLEPQAETYHALTNDQAFAELRRKGCIGAQARPDEDGGSACQM